MFELLKAAIGPAVGFATAVVALLVFRTQIASMLGSATSFKVPGFEIVTKYGEASTDKRVLHGQAKSIGGQSSAGTGTDWAKPGDLFWLGNDLMWATDVLLRGGASKEIALSLVQSCHHARQLGFVDDEVGHALAASAAEAAASSDEHWTLERRNEKARRIRDIANLIGGMAAAGQPHFEPWAPGIDPDAGTYAG